MQILQYVPGLGDLTAVLEGQRKDLARGDQDHSEVDRSRRQLQHRQYQIVEQLLALLVEPLDLLLELGHRLPPPRRLRLAVGVAWSRLVRHGPPRDEGEHRRRSELAEQEPRHAADADPAERRQGERDPKAPLPPSPLRHPCFHPAPYPPL